MILPRLRYGFKAQPPGQISLNGIIRPIRSARIPCPGAACQHRVEFFAVSSQGAVDGHIRRLLWECSTVKCACDEGRALSVAIQGTTTQEAAGSTPAVPTNMQGRALPYDVPSNQPGREPDGTQTESNCDTTESHAAQPKV